MMADSFLDQRQDTLSTIPLSGNCPEEVKLETMDFNQNGNGASRIEMTDDVFVLIS